MGKSRLEWTGTGNLESAPTVSPAPAKPYLADILPGQNRLYRLYRLKNFRTD
jgi:hypothetical protein